MKPVANNDHPMPQWLTFFDAAQLAKEHRATGRTGHDMELAILSGAVPAFLFEASSGPRRATLAEVMEYASGMCDRVPMVRTSDAQTWIDQFHAKRCELEQAAADLDARAPTVMNLAREIVADSDGDPYPYGRKAIRTARAIFEAIADGRLPATCDVITPNFEDSVFIPNRDEQLIEAARRSNGGPLRYPRWDVLLGDREVIQGVPLAQSLALMFVQGSDCADWQDAELPQRSGRVFAHSVRVRRDLAEAVGFTATPPREPTTGERLQDAVRSLAEDPNMQWPEIHRHPDVEKLARELRIMTPEALRKHRLVKGLGIPPRTKGRTPGRAKT